jgi:hypothetical protein
MFKLMVLLDISEGRPGMLVPVLSSPNTNMPYVQQMDEFLIVKEIVPFLEYENYLTISHESTQTIAIGDKGLIAFRSSDEAIICGDFEEVLPYIAQNKELISKNPLLRLQLQRIESAELNQSYEVWRTVASQIFKDDDQAKFWVDSELQLFQKQKKIWSDIDPIDADDPQSGDGVVYTALSEYSTEYLLRWLSNRANFPSKNWTKLWHYVHEKMPFDDRAAQIALAWMYSLDADDSDFNQTKSVIYALLQGWATLGKDYPDYGEFLSDRLATDPSLLFNFLRPKGLFRQLFEYLAAKGNLDDLLKVIAFCISDMPKEKYVIEAISSALSSIIYQTQREDSLSQPSLYNREFEQRHVLQAHALFDRLEQIGAFNDAI